MAQPSPVIAFDLDGTLVDTAPDLLDALDHVLAHQGFRPVNRDRGRQLIGGGARQLLLTALSENAVTPSPADLDAMIQMFLRYYSDHIANGSRTFAGVIEALDLLSARGALLAVCTNKMERLARKLLDQLDLTGRFAVIAGSDTYARAKPDPLPLLSVIADCGGAIGNAVMVGDSITDIATARAAGVPSVAVSFGYTQIAASDLGADGLISHFDQLPGTIARLLSPPASHVRKPAC